MKKLFLTIMALVSLTLSYAQTLHTIMMCNMQDQTLAVGNQNEVKEMKALMPKIANVLGYTNDFRMHSDVEFKYTILESEINSINVQDGDIVVYYYASHGVNWSDDEWPHMAFSDRQYSESKLYNTLCNKFPNAKLILCIAACCNMDAEGEAKKKRTYASFDPAKVKELFTGFSGHRSYLVSSSIRGQYSWCWVGGIRPGHLYGIALRDAIQQACEGTITPEWDYVLEEAKSKTLIYSGRKQMPQFTKKRW